MHDLTTTLSDEDKVDLAYDLAAAAATYKRISMKIDKILMKMDATPIEHFPDGTFIKILEMVPDFEPPSITEWKQRLNIGIRA